LSASPLSLFVFSLDDQRYALPLNQVESVTQAAAVTRVGQLPRALLGLLNVHGALLPVLDSRYLINLPSRPITVDDLFLLLRLQNEGWVLPVDAVHQVLELAPEALSPGSPRLGQSGCWLGWFELDGDVVLILDLPQTLSQETQMMPNGARHG
jgi:purine-binding chemotaxis protein CheW